MVINFNKKRRKIALILCTLLCIISAFLIINHKPEQETLAILDDREINNYIIDVVFNDKDKKIECNQNITYINNTDKTLWKTKGMDIQIGEVVPDKGITVTIDGNIKYINADGIISQ